MRVKAGGLKASQGLAPNGQRAQDPTQRLKLDHAQAKVDGSPNSYDAKFLIRVGVLLESLN